MSGVDMPTTPTISLRPPWGSAVAYWGRALDNRVDLIPWPWMVGQYVGIHQGQRFGEEQRQDALELSQRLEGRCVVPLEESGYPHGVLALARLVGFVDARRQDRVRAFPDWPGLPVTDVELGPLLEAHGVMPAALGPRMTVVGFKGEAAELVAAQVIVSPWFRGPVAWLFDDVRPFERPFQTPGRPEIWRLPSWIEGRARRAAGLR